VAHIIEKDEGTAAERTIHFRLFTSDGTSPDTGASNDSVIVARDSATTFTPNVLVTAVHSAQGMYSLVLTASDVSNLGPHAMYHTQGDFPQHVANFDVVNFNPYSSQSNIPLVPTVTDVTNQVTANMAQISGDGPAADNLETMLDGTGGQILSLGQLYIAASGSSSAIDATGSTTGHGILATGGASGDGVRGTGGGTTGAGLRGVALAGNIPGIWGLGIGTASGIRGTGGATGPGIEGVGGGTSGPGLLGLASAGNDAGIEGVAHGTGSDISGTLGTDAITATVIATGAVDADAIAANAITSAKIATDAIGTAQIAAGTYSGTTFGSASTILAGGIAAASFAAGAIDAAAVATDAIDADAIADNAIDAGAIAANAITSAKIATDAIGTAQIAAGTYSGTTFGSLATVATGGIIAASFGAGAIDAAAIATDAIGAAELAQDAAREIADEVLDRDIAGSASGGARNVRSALRYLRNRVDATSGSVLTVYQENDSTSAWTASITTSDDPSNINEINPQ
jgi:hypothetical protein